jgi:hypothetical protein
VGSVNTTGSGRDPEESPKSQGFHDNHNAESHLLTGDALERGMVDLLRAGSQE